jgi:hypothetical protein
LLGVLADQQLQRRREMAIAVAAQRAHAESTSGAAA